MKKSIAVLLVFVIVLSIVACNGPKTETTQDSTKNSTKNVTEDTTLNPIEEAKNKLQEAFNTCCTGDYKWSYAKLGSDKMSLTIDTKPNNTYFSYEDDAYSAIVSINRFLELPSSLSEKLSSTRAIDGTQSQNCGKYTVTWNYHPDNGMKVIYEVNP